ncbi:phosphatidate cytidylyltransferase [Mucilaginibacter sp. FT3.2]|uniref:phosphatidate cytidylyltransferase n=1 Tax=Mucilaginibacter sp. FT3.2 TaxID=2723090 RepID=UPI00161B7C4D|nr:phosphatidate cytidylyltransferase [Mucilaginibacter sp. FT3.2]MBB6234603.1 phosphatidate cytidylyltransferase [Mucilaginibacter sp. FT3.2]
MKLRAITGFFFIIVMIASNLLGAYVFSIFYLLLASFCLFEFYKLVREGGFTASRETGIINGALFFFFVAANCYFPAWRFILFLPVTFSAVYIQELYKKTPAPFSNIGFTFLGILFAVVPFMFFHAMAFMNGTFNFHIPLAFLIMLWSNDTGAYLVGSKMGKTKLFERHSPKKTYEGLIGGIIISAIAALILAHFYVELNWKQWVTIAILISCFGTMGDLVESMFKRSINVKDSGGILPGHGGLLDRFDGLLMAAPIVYAYLYFISN